MAPEPSNVDQNLFALLNGIRAVEQPNQYVRCVLLPFPKMEPGTIRISKGVGVIKGGDDYHTIINVLQGKLCIEVQDRTEEVVSSETNVDIVLEEIRKPNILFYYAAPWFIEWLCNSTITPDSIRDKCLSILHLFLRRRHDLIYRGQNKDYGRVRSSLSRHWNTSSQEAIQILTERNVQEAKQRAPSIKDMPELDIQIAIQHLGGKTNLIDFSGLPWVALYFSCNGEDGEAGQLLSLDVSRDRREYKVHKGTEITYPVASERATNQMGFLVEPVNGELSGPRLDLVTEIHSHEKPVFRSWLKRIGISRKSLFADLMAYIEEEQEEIPARAFVHMLSQWLRDKEFNRAYMEVHSRISILEDNGDEIGLRMSFYYRGLANAYLGRLNEALSDLNKAEELFSRGVPKVVEKNKRIIKGAMSSGVRSRSIRRRLSSKLSLAIDASFYSEIFEGYRFTS